MNLRAQVEQDLEFTLEGDWGLSVELTDPTGKEHTKSFNNPTEDLKGQVLWDTIVQNPDTGLENISNKPVLTLRRTSLEVVPSDSDFRKWSVKIPRSPVVGAPLDNYKIGKPPEGGRSIGFIRLNLMRAEQS